MTLHTGSSCSISSSSMLGHILTDNCDVSNGDNTGCAISSPDSATYGSGFNAGNGGIFATLFTESSILVWFWPRSTIPFDLTNNTPDPASWPTPLANFSGSCDFGTSFGPQNLVFDTTFCGDWAGSTWSSSDCAAKAPTCEEFVANNSQAFDQTYWSINGLKVFQEETQFAHPLNSTRASFLPSTYRSRRGQRRRGMISRGDFVDK